MTDSDGEFWFRLWIIIMTPNSIKELAKIRHDFYSLFAIAIDIKVSITKGNSHSCNPSKVSWYDCYRRYNYIYVYAHIAPDKLLLDRPFIIRIGINKGLDIVPSNSRKEVQSDRRKLLRFDLTLLPDELILFIPWLISLLEAYDKGSNISIPPPCPLNFATLDEVLRYGAWTQKATVACYGKKGKQEEARIVCVHGSSHNIP